MDNTLTSVETTAPVCDLFLSWSHRNKRLKQALIDDRLQYTLHNIGDVKFRWWEDSRLLAGDEVDPAISRRLTEADFGVLLLSPEFLASRYIRDEELPHLLGPANRVLPVALKPFGQFDAGMDLGGIEHTWAFYERGKAFSELDHAGRDRFALNLAAEVRRRVLGLGGWISL